LSANMQNVIKRRRECGCVEKLICTAVAPPEPFSRPSEKGHQNVKSVQSVSPEFEQDSKTSRGLAHKASERRGQLQKAAKGRERVLQKTGFS